MTRARISEAQANAEALTRRSSTYADDHAKSWEVRFDRQPPRSLRQLVRDLRRACADEVPTRIHSRDTDEGGDPAWAPEFTRYITGSDFATDRGDDGSTEVYLTPYRAAIAAMRNGKDEATRRRCAIVEHVVAGSDPVEAAMIEGVPEWCAKDVAIRALGIFWVRYSDVRLDLRRTETAA